MDAGRGRDRGIAWRARNAGAAMPRPAPSVNVADISTNCATEPANFVGRLIAIRSLSRRRVRHRHPAVEADREPQSCRRRAESRRASAANKYSIASMHAPSRTEAHRGGTGPAFGSGLTGPHRLPAVSIREIVIAVVSCRVVSCRCRCRCRARSPPVFHPFDSSRRRPRARPASNAAGESPAFDPPDVGSRIPIRAIPYRPLH